MNEWEPVVVFPQLTPSVPSMKTPRCSHGTTRSTNRRPCSGIALRACHWPTPLAINSAWYHVISIKAHTEANTNDGNDLTWLRSQWGIESPATARGLHRFQLHNIQTLLKTSQQGILLASATARSQVFFRSSSCRKFWRISSINTSQNWETCNRWSKEFWHAHPQLLKKLTFFWTVHTGIATGEIPDMASKKLQLLLCSGIKMQSFPCGLNSNLAILPK